MERIPTLPSKERLILELLVSGGPLHGLGLVQRSDGSLKKGTVYVTLARMESKGFLTSEAEPLPEGAIGLPRRRYHVTGLGARALRAWSLMAAELRLEVQT